MIPLLRGILWALLWLACGALGVWLLSIGCIFGVWPLLIWLLAGVNGLATALGK